MGGRKSGRKPVPQPVRPPFCYIRVCNKCQGLTDRHRVYCVKCGVKLDDYRLIKTPAPNPNARQILEKMASW